MNKVIVHGVELDNVVVTIEGDVVTVATTSVLTYTIVPASGGGPGEEPVPTPTPL
jgi:hypothetical protein